MSTKPVMACNALFRLCSVAGFCFVAGRSLDIKAPRKARRYWAVALGGLRVSSTGQVAALQAPAALLDSGTSLLLASDADAATLNNVRVPVLRR